MNELEQAARDYLSRGLPVIALSGKTPNTALFRHGLDDALTPADLEDERIDRALETAFGHPETTGIGIVIPYPYVVVDIDSEVGAVNWKGLAGEDEFIPDRWVAKTAHGLHLWYACMEPTGSFKPFGKDGGVDIKGQQSYVAAPPSWHPGYPDEGIAPGPLYEWLLAPGAEPPREAPDPLLAKIKAHNFDIEGTLLRKTKQRRVRHQPLEGGKLWASVGFEHLIEGMGSAGSGNRNNYLHWAAATMAEEGALDEEFAALREAALAAGLTSLEVKRTIRSARSDRA